ncbi:MAG: FAD-dependent thymidylate synthase [Proteobacteria bacterium]|nr:FAD-dependent thymidylate synthase [Pseudomonadota bacterium]NBP16788.1 FAD-dependent thymidylate synthase [bacterium]
MIIVNFSEVTLVDKMGSDLSVVNAARVSFAKQSEFTTDESGKQFLSEQDERLIRFLATHNHWTPFGHASLSLHFKTPIFVARQLFKHEVGGVKNEISRRYVDNEPEFYIPDQWRKRHENKKQGSHEDQFVNINPAVIDNTIEKCLSLYNYLLEQGVAPEQARMILPQNMMVEWYWTGSLYFFARICNLRLQKDAQLETREVAEQIREIMQKEFPVSTKYLI